MNTQLDLFPEQMVVMPKKKTERLRINIGRYCTPEQKLKDEIIRAAMAEETAKRHDTAIWRTLRRQNEKILRLQRILKENNITF